MPAGLPRDGWWAAASADRLERPATDTALTRLSAVRVRAIPIVRGVSVVVDRLQEAPLLPLGDALAGRRADLVGVPEVAVSYTHLTLPTTSRV